VLVYRIKIKLGIHEACNLDDTSQYVKFFKETIHNKLPLNSSFSIFGHISFDLHGMAPDWMSNVITKKSFKQTETNWWKISDFDEEVGDIKNIWELSRFQWAVFLAINSSSNRENLKILNNWLLDWADKNKPYFGPNWKCAQEASLRVINLSLAMIFLGTFKNPSKDLVSLLKVHLKRITSTTSYAAAQNNNHIISEAAALIIGGIILSDAENEMGEKYYLKGRLCLERSINKLVFSEGTFSQYSSNYHRLVLDILSCVEIWLRLAKRKPLQLCTYKKIASMWEWLYSITDVTSGKFPFVGANDGANLFCFFNYEYNDARPSLIIAGALFKKSKVFDNHCQTLNYLLNNLDLNNLTARNKIQESIICRDGGFAILRNKNSLGFFRIPKYSYRPSQCDGLHIDYWFNGLNILRDAGTYSYNADPVLLDNFDGSIGHNTIRFDGRNQMERLGRFLYKNWLQPENFSSSINSSENQKVSCGYTDSYKASHYREVNLQKKGIRIIDEINGFQNYAEQFWRLPDLNWKINKVSQFSLTVASKNIYFNINTTMPINDAVISRGMESMNYNKYHEIPILRIKYNQYGMIDTFIENN